MPKLVALYSPQANGRAEKMVQTMKATMKRMTVESSSKWDEELPIIESSYRETKMNDGFSFHYFLFEVICRRPVIKVVPRVSDTLNTEPTLSSIRARPVILLAAEAYRADRMTNLSQKTLNPYAVEDSVILLKPNCQRLPSLVSRLSGPFVVMKSEGM